MKTHFPMIYPQQRKKNQLIRSNITAALHIFIKLVKHFLTKLIQILSAMKKRIQPFPKGQPQFSKSTLVKIICKFQVIHPSIHPLHFHVNDYYVTGTVNIPIPWLALYPFTLIIFLSKFIIATIM